MTRSAVPGYLASAAAFALSAAAPVTVVPIPGGTPWGADEVAAAGAAATLLAVVLLAEPQPASRPPTATAAAALARVRRWRRRRVVFVRDMPSGSADSGIEEGVARRPMARTGGVMLIVVLREPESASAS